MNILQTNDNEDFTRSFCSIFQIKIFWVVMFYADILSNMRSIQDLNKYAISQKVEFLKADYPAR